MNFENKFVVAYNEEGVVVAQTQGNGEIYTPSNVTVEMFDTSEERDTFIVAAGVEVKEFDTLEEGEKFIEEEILK